MASLLPAADPPAATRSLRVLVADDNPAQLLLTSEMAHVADLGPVEVAQAATADQLHAHLARASFDVVLLDYRFGADDGLVLARELLAADPDRIVILSTAYTDPALEQAAAEAGVADLIAKQTLSRDVLGRCVRYARQRQADRRALAHAEQRFRETFERAPVGMVVSTQHGELLEVNDALTEITGYTTAELLGRPATMLAHPSEHAAMDERMRTAGESQIGEGRAERRWVHKDGRLLWVVTRSVTIRDADGTPSHLLTHVADITERLMVEQALRESEHRMRSLAAAVPVGILRMDAAGRWTYVNDLFRTLWNLPDGDDHATYDWQSSMHPDDRTAVVSGWGAAMERGTPYEAEFRIVGPDGESRWAWTRAIPERDHDGAIIGWLATTLDVHERHLAHADQRAGRLGE